MDHDERFHALRPDDVVAVLLTHSHRDHIGAWRHVRQAPFYLARSEVELVFGRDTVHTFLLPGHTAGSAAYLIRGTLFAGDAISWTWLRGFRAARGGYSDDVKQARRSLESFRDRVAPYRVEWICSAHLKCSAVSAQLWADLLGS